jgi:hypothetical protein
MTLLKRAVRRLPPKCIVRGVDQEDTGEDLLKHIDRNLHETRDFLQLMEQGEVDKAISMHKNHPPQAKPKVKPPSKESSSMEDKPIEMIRKVDKLNDEIKLLLEKYSETPSEQQSHESPEKYPWDSSPPTQSQEDSKQAGLVRGVHQKSTNLFENHFDVRGEVGREKYDLPKQGLVTKQQTNQQARDSNDSEELENLNNIFGDADHLTEMFTNLERRDEKLERKFEEHSVIEAEQDSKFDISQHYNMSQFVSSSVKNKEEEPSQHDLYSKFNIGKQKVVSKYVPEQQPKPSENVPFKVFSENVQQVRPQASKPALKKPIQSEADDHYDEEDTLYLEKVKALVLNTRKELENMDMSRLSEKPQTSLYDPPHFTSKPNPYDLHAKTTQNSSSLQNKGLVHLKAMKEQGKGQPVTINLNTRGPGQAYFPKNSNLGDDTEEEEQPRSRLGQGMGPPVTGYANKVGPRKVMVQERNEEESNSDGDEDGFNLRRNLKN